MKQNKVIKTSNEYYKKHCLDCVIDIQKGYKNKT